MHWIIGRPDVIYIMLGHYSINRLLCLSVIAWCLASMNCFAGEREQAIVTTTFPQASVVDLSIGLIEGKTHLAAVVFDKSQSTIALAVFAEDEGGLYRLRTKSKWMDNHPRWYSTTSEIKRGSVFFSLSGNGGCCSDYSNQYQFKPHDGQFLLVGTESTTTGIESKEDETEQAIDSQMISYRYGTSVNYLTGEILHWRVQAPSAVDEPFKDDILRVKTGKKRVEKRLRFPFTKMVRLEDFDIWAESDKSE